MDFGLDYIQTIADFAAQIQNNTDIEKLPAPD